MKHFTTIILFFLISTCVTSAIAQPNINSVKTLSATFAEVAKLAESAVVNIDAKSKLPDINVRGEGFNEFENRANREVQRPQISVGSGFIVDGKGFIITNAHVVEDAAKVTVSLQNGEKYVAKIIGTDEETDLAVLKIETGRELSIVKLGDSDAIEVGEWVLAIGSPFGLEQTVTAGIISKIKRQTDAFKQFQKFIQTDAAINRGNSGGPLLNMKGEVVGINSQIATTSGDASGIGFALPSNEASYVYQQILANGKVKRGYLGVVLESVKQEFAKVYGLTEAKGAIITEMRDKQSPAGKAGLLVNDIVTEFDGKSIENAQDLIAKVAASEPGKDFAVSYFRESGATMEKKSTTIKLAERPSNNKAIGDETVPKKIGLGKIEPPILGLSLTDITPTIAKVQGIEMKKGVLVKEVSPDSTLSEITNLNGSIALKTGDIIQRLNRLEVPTIKAFTEEEKKLKKGDAVVLHILSLDRISKTFQNRIVQFTIQ
jgi:serine protease Do